MMQNNHTRKITFLDKPMQLVGRRLALNKPAPDFILVDNYLGEVRLDKFKDKIKVVTSLVSLDTPVCELQLKEFNKNATRFSPDAVVLVVSKDLPFAQQRMCINQQIYNLEVLSDYRYSSFGINYGLLIKELNLLARAVIILDSNNIVRYIQIGKELAQQLDYKDALSNLSEIIENKLFLENKEQPEKCMHYENITSPISIDIIKNRLLHFSNWQLIGIRMIVREIKFKDFKEAKYFLDLVAIVSEEQGHHPTFTLVDARLKITLTTHAVGGLTENDFIMAKIIDELGE